jgi:hypothetical protein
MSKILNNKRKQWIEQAKKLKQWEIRLIELRNAGDGYNEIRDALQKEFPRNKMSFNSNDRLRVLLYKKGKLHNAYMTYSELMAEESFEQGQLILRNSHKRAAMTIANLLNPAVIDTVRLGAAKDVLDRNAGKATTSIEFKEDRELDEMKNKIKNLFIDDDKKKKKRS